MWTIFWSLYWICFSIACFMFWCFVETVPWPGTEPTPPALEGEVWTPGLPGKSPLPWFFRSLDHVGTLLTGLAFVPLGFQLIFMLRLFCLGFTCVAHYFKVSDVLLLVEKRCFNSFVFLAHKVLQVTWKVWCLSAVNLIKLLLRIFLFSNKSFDPWAKVDLEIVSIIPWLWVRRT